MPSDPPAIFTPPGGGSPPAAPGAVFTPAGGGGSPAAPAAIFIPAGGGGGPSAPAAVFTPAGGGGSPSAPAAVFTPPGAGEVLGVSGTLTDGTDPVVFPQLSVTGEYNGEPLWESGTYGPGTEYWSVSYLEATGWSLYYSTNEADTAEWQSGPMAPVVDPWSESLTFSAIGAATGTPTVAAVLQSPAAIFTPAGGGGGPSAPAAVFTPAGGGGSPASPPAIFTPSGGGAPSAPPTIYEPGVSDYDGGSASSSFTTTIDGGDA